MIQNKS